MPTWPIGSRMFDPKDRVPGARKVGVELGSNDRRLSLHRHWEIASQASVLWVGSAAVLFMRRAIPSIAHTQFSRRLRDLSRQFATSLR
ncbi:hypothetical protein NITLEN_110002 [Nitrospira lenta]|uniref:Uncharacterized protein n=1 Tax=Nitrospira lenta TaxID=1436998 RepID=A0A330L3G9_9BACT|nr:hypothetical protein NITLEN_110002 [Nitrospira lenta]